jgi:glycosyltransferase involved in cell wall biosynthesis
MDTPLVSFCIPTYNRGRYLRSLLEMMAQQLPRFPHACEVVISDNGSSDDTPDVVAAFADRLPIRAFRHDSNLGGSANWHHVISKAQGTYVIYVADDDGLLLERVATVVSLLCTQPQVGVAYAPWLLFDLVAQKEVGQFYTQERDLHIERGDFRALLDGVLRHGIFPEISICRREVLNRVMPRVNEQAFWAFVHSAEFLQHADVLMLKDPFYVSITRYFDDEQREQAGSGEAEYAWDRYRGGLEYILGRAAAGMQAAERVGFQLRIQDIVAQRISVAVRLRVATQRDAIETYYLAYRLKAMGQEHLLPVPIESLRTFAAIDFLMTDVELNRHAEQLIVVGAFDDGVKQHLQCRARLPLRFAEGASRRDLAELRNVLVLTHGDPAPLVDGSADLLASRNVRVLGEHQLLEKFAA